jgi:myo-inositol-1(or 4)-monophosphatase
VGHQFELFELWQDSSWRLEERMNSFLDVAIETAREAGAILLAEFDRPVNISYKGDVDIVTQADKRSEQAIVARLRSHFPKHAIVAEEGGGNESDSPFRWHVDPLDGTTNFAHGYPCFCVSLGLEQAGEMIAGVIFQPVTGELFTAARGEGAYLNQKKIEVSRIEKLATSLLSTGFPSVKRAQNPNIHYYWDFTLRSHGVRRDGSAAMDLAAVACGRFEGFWEFGLHPWDTAAGILLVREAGGVVSQFNGQPYRLGDRELMASNGRVHEEMKQVAAGIAERTATKAPLT